MDHGEDNQIANKVKQTDMWKHNKISLQDGIDFFNGWAKISSEVAEKLQKGWKRDRGTEKRK